MVVSSVSQRVAASLPVAVSFAAIRTIRSLWALAVGVILLDLAAQAVHVTNPAMGAGFSGLGFALWAFTRHVPTNSRTERLS